MEDRFGRITRNNLIHKARLQSLVWSEPAALQGNLTMEVRIGNLHSKSGRER